MEKGEIKLCDNRREGGGTKGQNERRTDRHTHTPHTPHTHTTHTPHTPHTHTTCLLHAYYHAYYMLTTFTLCDCRLFRGGAH